MGYIRLASAVWGLWWKETFHGSQPTENTCLLESGILYGGGERGQVWFRVGNACFSAVGAQRPSTPLLTLLTPGETAARSAPSREEDCSASPLMCAWKTPLLLSHLTGIPRKQDSIFIPGCLRWPLSRRPVWLGCINLSAPRAQLGNWSRQLGHPLPSRSWNVIPGWTDTNLSLRPSRPAELDSQSRGRNTEPWVPHHSPWGGGGGQGEEGWGSRRKVL